jgi:hypothetical protein
MIGGFMKQVDELIRGERAAVQSINKVLDKIHNDSERRELDAIRQDHIFAVDKLKRFASSDFSEEMLSSGAWGSLAKVFTTGASLFGDKATLQALKVGEDHGLNEYLQAVESPGLNSELKIIIERELLPNQKKHIRTIEGYLH